MGYKYFISAPLSSHSVSFSMHNQQTLKAVDALLSMCDENGVKERQGLEACALAFKKYTEGDLDKRLDTLLEVWPRHAWFWRSVCVQGGCSIVTQRFWWLQGQDSAANRACAFLC